LEHLGPLIELKGLSNTFAKRMLVRTRSFALHNIDLAVHTGEIVGIVGESGSGKSTIANIVMRLMKFNDGTYLYNGRDVSLFGRQDDLAFKSDVQIVFQDPYGSLNPRATVKNIINESLLIHKKVLSKAQKQDRIHQLFNEVGLSNEDLERYPREFSGGQRQRIAIARAMAVEPKLLVCDEPLSSLDVSIQAQVIELFEKLIKQHNLTIIFITHDVNVARLLCGRVYVMFNGRIIEQGNAQTVLNNPQEEYTKRLLDAAY
jgi:oligopeptide transport system ATP-binding protein